MTKGLAKRQDKRSYSALASKLQTPKTPRNSYDINKLVLVTRPGARWSSCWCQFVCFPGI